jgi:hypothetical protein
VETSVSPTKSTATSTKKNQKTFTAEEVQALMKDTIAASAEKIADQEARHIAEMNANKEETDFRRKCIDALSKHKGFQAPIFPVSHQIASIRFSKKNYSL